MSETQERLDRIDKRPIPPRHALDFYKVLGSLKGLYLVLGEENEVAELRALETLGRCKPERRRAPHD